MRRWAGSETAQYCKNASVAEMPKSAEQEWGKIEALISSKGSEDHYAIREELRRNLDATMGWQRNCAVLQECVSGRNAEERRTGMGEDRSADFIQRQRRSLRDPRRVAQKSGCDDGLAAKLRSTARMRQWQKCRRAPNRNGGRSKR